MVAKKTGLYGHEALGKKFLELANISDEKEYEKFLYSKARRLKRHVVSDIRRKLRRKTGNLSRGVVAKKYSRRIKGSPKVFVGFDYRFAKHAELVEYGHGGPKPAPPHRFFKSVIRQDERSIRSNILTYTREVIVKKAKE